MPQDERVVDLAGLSERTLAAMEALLNHPDRQVRSDIETLLEGVDSLHREALRRLRALLRERDAWSAAMDDPWLEAVFSFYDLTADAEMAAVEAALAGVRPYVAAHGGKLEVLAVEDGVVRLRLGGACHGCAASSATLRYGVEEALRRSWPGFAGIEVVPADTDPAVGAPPTFVDVLGVEEIGGGRLIEAGGRLLNVRWQGEVVRVSPASDPSVILPAIVEGGRVKVAVAMRAVAPPLGTPA